MSSDFRGSGDDQCQCWQMVLEIFKSSGLSVRQFCKQEGFSEPTFYSWRKRLGTTATLKLETSNHNRSKNNVQAKSGCSKIVQNTPVLLQSESSSIKSAQDILTKPSSKANKSKIGRNTNASKILAVENSEGVDGSSTQDEQRLIEVKMQPEKSFGLELVLASGNTLRIGSGTDNKTLGGAISVLQKAGGNCPLSLKWKLLK